MQYVFDFCSWRTRKLRLRNAFHLLMQSMKLTILPAHSMPAQKETPPSLSSPPVGNIAAVKNLAQPYKSSNRKCGSVV